MSNTCLKIIACGGRDSADDDRLEASSQGKGASEKRGWSFRKRSARHRVLSNTVVLETPAAAAKEVPESAAIDFQRLPDSTIPDKISAEQLIEGKPLSPMPVKSKLSENGAAEPIDVKAVAKHDDIKDNVEPEEPIVIIIQSAIRGFLAQKVLLKHKNVIKLQAVVRGHLVRRHAVGSLRCVQAIVKMQALVRARRARIIEEQSVAAWKPSDRHAKDIISRPMVNSGIKPPVKYSSMEKLLSNRFARQLLESTPRTKSISIKCDPSKSDSAWKWMQIWVAVPSTENELSLDTKQEETKKVEPVDSTKESDIVSEKISNPADLNPRIEASEKDENTITFNADKFDVQACKSSSPSVTHNLDQSEAQEISEINSKDIISDHQEKGSDSPHKIMATVPGEMGAEVVQTLKRVAVEQLEGEGKKISFGSRKASNPAFLAAQSKFKELSSVTNSTKSNYSSDQDKEVDYYTVSVSSFTDSISRKKESAPSHASVSKDSKVQYVGPDSSRVQFGGSECGTELSISSTLDSPYSSDCGANKFEHEGKIAEDTNGTPGRKENLEVEAKGELTNMDSDSRDFVSVELERYRGTAGGDADADGSVVSADISNVEQMPNTDVTGLRMHSETGKGHQACESSPAASPRSHVTVPEPQGTPSSDVSVKPKRTRGDRSGSNHKLRSSSAGKKSPSNLNYDSGARNNVQQPPKDHKTGKRRNSFGSPRPDLVYQEPRDSGSNNPLPSYMQPTESARAKVLANSSPRSSPDVQDKDVYIKKRHSLPGANGRHGSPRIQRTMSQTQQAMKGNGTQSPQEKKWQR